MISLDGSIIPAILVFLVLVVALNRLLFQPILKVQEERESRTTGLMTQTRKKLDHNLELFDQYQTAIKNCRLEGYRRQEQVRAEAMKNRAEALAQARSDAEKLMQESRDFIQAQVQAAKAKLDYEAREIAGGIAASILRRTA
jgi:F-type H+-transporting ATPase subunit b